MNLPPPEKIYEAWGALTDGRFHTKSLPASLSGEATVISSSGQKEYQLKWDNNNYYSNDTATWWQNYPGYPVLALLMYRGILPYNPEIAQFFKNIAWETINREAKRDYAKALELVFEKLKLPLEKKTEIQNLASETYTKLSTLSIDLHRLIKPKKAIIKS